jgi:hypothetical protein
MDPILVELTPGRETIPLPDEVLAARAAVAAAAVAYVTVADDRLERPWAWRGAEADIRYGLYHGAELLEAATAVAARVIDAAVREGRLDPPAPAAGRIAPATLARWDLHGLLAGLDDASLDADPGGGEWTVRQTLGHVVAGQRGYGWYSAWWLSQTGADPFPTAVPASVADRMPDEHGSEMAGSLDDIRARLDATLDDSTARLGSLDDAELAARARWAGIPVDIGFRLGRWGSHIREHTIQVEKTLAMLGRQPSEVERVVRTILAAYGRLEAVVFARRPEVLAATDERGRAVADAFAVAQEVRATAESVAAAARA